MTNQAWTERCLSELRWVNVIGYGKPVLQQAWEVVSMYDGHPLNVRKEWRDVPTVDGTD